MEQLQNNSPERLQDFELDINFITTYEYLTHNDDFETYKELAKLFMRNANKTILEEDLQKRYNSTDIENIVKSSSFIMETMPFRKQDGSFAKRYVDISDSYDVQPEDSLYDVFFAYKLRQVPLLSIDDFLEYHFYFYYDNDLAKFKRFLNLCLRTHKDKFNPETEITVAEWIEAKEKQISQLENGQLGKVRSKRPKRTNNDNKTSLTQEQTVLLAHYLQEKNVFYNGYLTDAEIATAFEILTGYSYDKLRLSIPKADNFKSHENIKAIHNLATGLVSLIEKSLPETKK
jgi:hypothetical protein